MSVKLILAISWQVQTNPRKSSDKKDLNGEPRINAEHHSFVKNCDVHKGRQVRDSISRH